VYTQDEVALTFFFLTFFLIRTNGLTTGRTLRYIEAAHCLKKEDEIQNKMEEDLKKMEDDLKKMEDDLKKK
jgi:hypothetical protein